MKRYANLIMAMASRKNPALPIRVPSYDVFVRRLIAHAWIVATAGDMTTGLFVRRLEEGAFNRLFPAVPPEIERTIRAVAHGIARLRDQDKPVAGNSGRGVNWLIAHRFNLKAIDALANGVCDNVVAIARGESPPIRAEWLYAAAKSAIANVEFERGVTQHRAAAIIAERLSWKRGDGDADPDPMESLVADVIAAQLPDEWRIAIEDGARVVIDMESKTAVITRAAHDADQPQRYEISFRDEACDEHAVATIPSIAIPKAARTPLYDSGWNVVGYVYGSPIDDQDNDELIGILQCNGEGFAEGWNVVSSRTVVYRIRR